MADEVLLTLAAEIVSAHVSNNPVTASELPGLIQSVYGSLAGLGQEVQAPPAVQEPAVSIRSSVKPDAIACLECGAKMKMLKRHLATNHALTPAKYRAKWNLASDYPMVAPSYAATRKELALKIGLGRKPGQKVAKTPAAKVITAPAKPKATSAKSETAPATPEASTAKLETPKAKPKTATAKPKKASAKPETPPASPERPATKPKTRSRKPAAASPEAG